MGDLSAPFAECESVMSIRRKLTKLSRTNLPIVLAG